MRSYEYAEVVSWARGSASIRDYAAVHSRKMPYQGGSWRKTRKARERAQRKKQTHKNTSSNSLEVSAVYRYDGVQAVGFDSAGCLAEPHAHAGLANRFHTQTEWGMEEGRLSPFAEQKLREQEEGQKREGERQQEVEGQEQQAEHLYHRYTQQERQEKLQQHPAGSAVEASTTVVEASTTVESKHNTVSIPRNANVYSVSRFNVVEYKPVRGVRARGGGVAENAGSNDNSAAAAAAATRVVAPAHKEEKRRKQHAREQAWNDHLPIP
jgi:hypothetical protein